MDLLYSIITWVFSGLGIALFTSKSKIKLVLNPFTIITKPKEEELFISSSIKTFRRITLHIFFTIFATGYFIVITDINKTEGSSNIPMDIAFRWWSSILFFALLLFLLLIVLIKNFRNSYFDKLSVAMKNNKKFALFLFLTLLLSMIGYFILLSMMYGVLINSFVIEIGDTHKVDVTTSTTMLTILPYEGYKELGAIILSLSIIYYLFLIPLIRVIGLMSSSKLTATIKMKNGTIYHDKYIINGDIDGFILIADENNTSAIGKQMIQRIEIDEIRFTTISSQFGVISTYTTYPKSNILLPPTRK
ncbi:hypothetical protein [Paenibacillus alba]|uniref:Uncharacterized protein n=1 Tax=Paenibacillus alba TaxID=1197127 RepID=A0ABU6FY33_9BACL|nr:hypothetical protein [Paenibacillus alba]MEC0226818.1 hypothetical protein [Paenibacillus alba]